MIKLTKDLIFEVTLTQGLVCPCLGAIHMYMTITLKYLLLRNRFTNQGKFNVESSWEKRTRICINGPGHMTKIAARPYKVKTLKNLLLQNPKADDVEIWHAVLGNQVLPSLYK